MPKYYCDYCDVYLTHDSTSVRKAHNTGRNHLVNVRDYYAGMGHNQAQDFIDNITKAFERAGGNRGGPPPGYGAPRQFGPPGGNFGPPGSGFGGPRPPFGGGPPGMGGPPPSFVPQQGPPPQFGGGISNQQPGFPQGGFPPQGGFAPQMQQGQPPMMGGGMSPPNGQFGGMPPQQSPMPAMSPPGQGVGMQINPERAAALGLR